MVAALGSVNSTSGTANTELVLPPDYIPATVTISPYIKPIPDSTDRYWVYTFLDTDTTYTMEFTNVTTTTPITCNCFAVAGGGTISGGAGGAGGMVVIPYMVSSDRSITINVGAGGVGSDGANTTLKVDGVDIPNLPAIGGGKGANPGFGIITGSPGGSGGGGAGAGRAVGRGGAGTSGQGNRGGKGCFGFFLSCSCICAGGGGGAGGPGIDGNMDGGAGGPGKTPGLAGIPNTIYATGGFANNFFRTTPLYGKKNTGDGNSGSGIVIIAIPKASVTPAPETPPAPPTPPTPQGPTVTVSPAITRSDNGLYWVYNFTTTSTPYTMTFANIAEPIVLNCLAVAGGGGGGPLGTGPSGIGAGGGGAGGFLEATYTVLTDEIIPISVGQGSASATISNGTNTTIGTTITAIGGGSGGNGYGPVFAAGANGGSGGGGSAIIGLGTAGQGNNGGKTSGGSNNSRGGGGGGALTVGGSVSGFTGGLGGTGKNPSLYPGIPTTTTYAAGGNGYDRTQVPVVANSGNGGSWGIDGSSGTAVVAILKTAIV